MHLIYGIFRCFFEKPLDRPDLISPAHQSHRSVDFRMMHRKTAQLLKFRKCNVFIRECLILDREKIKFITEYLLLYLKIKKDIKPSKEIPCNQSHTRTPANLRVRIRINNNIPVRQF